MRVNINKYQIGGGLLTYKPLPMMPSGIGAPIPPKEDNFNINDILGGKGLTSDTIAYASQLESVYQQYDNLNPAMRDSPYGVALRRQLKGDPKALSILEGSKKSFESAKAYLGTAKAFADYATFQGNVIVHDAKTKQEQIMSIPEYWQAMKKDPSKMRALTYGEVAELRENDVRYAGNNKILSFLTGAVSTSTALDEVREFMANIKDHIRSTTSTTAEERQIEGGVNQMAKGLSYIKSSEGESFKSNTEQLKAAAKTMWANLDDASKNVFKMRAIQTYPELKNLDAAAMGLAMSMLDPMHETDYKEKASEVPTKDPASKKTGGEGDTPLKYYTRLSQGFGKPVQEPFAFKSKDGDYASITFNGTVFDDVVDPSSGEVIGKARISDMNGLLAQGDVNSISFNGVPVSQEKLQDFVYQQQKPRKIESMFKVVNHIIVPDLEAEYNLHKANVAITEAEKQQRAPLTYAIKRKIYEDNGVEVNPIYGDPIIHRKHFIVLPKVTTTSKVLGDKNVDDSMRLTGDVLKNDYESIRQMYESLYLDKGTTKSAPKTTTKNTGNSIDMLQGNLFILANDAGTTSGLTVDKSGPLAEKNTLDYQNFYKTPGRPSTTGFSPSELFPNK